MWCKTITPKDRAWAACRKNMKTTVSCARDRISIPSYSRRTTADHLSGRAQNYIAWSGQGQTAADAP
jgi:hypothetical protein